MASLIIAILAIALISTISVIALNYGGTIINTAQADAQASELVANATKVANALRSWSRNNGGGSTLTETATKSCSNGRSACWETGTALDLISGSNMYMDVLPLLGSYAQGNGSSDYYFKAMPISNIAWGNEGTNFTSLFAVITSMSVCNAVARLSRGDSAVPLIISAGSTLTISSTTTGTSFATVMANSDFDCAYNDVNSNSTLDSSESMFFIYKVF